MQERGLRLVVRGVRGHHDSARPKVIGQLVEEGVPRDAPSLLDSPTVLGGQRRHIGPTLVWLKAQGCRRARHEARVVHRRFTQPVVEMRDVQLPCASWGEPRGQMH